jgi:DNA mismatch repair protein MutS
MVHSHDFYKLYQETYKKYTKEYSKVCVFLQKGSFYEIYGQQDPKTKEHLNTGWEVMNMLSLQIHTYPDDAPEGMTGYYGGVPVFALDKWASRLTGGGWTVVIMDEVRNGAGVIKGREVVKVLSAGTHIEAAESNKSFFLSSLWLETDCMNAPKFGVATADLTTGQVFLYEGKATGKSDVWHTDDLRHFFQVYPPKELLLFIRGFQLQLEEEELRRTFYIPKAPIHIKNAHKEQQGSFENLVTRLEYLRDHFQPKSSLPLRVWLRCNEDGNSLQERALVCLLRFADDHVSKLADCLQAPMLWHPTQSLQIINNALTQLNLIGSSEQQCVEDLFAAPITPMGKRSLTARLCSPVAEHQLILKRQEEIDWILQSPDLQKDLEIILSGIYDLSRLHRTLLRANIKPTDVIQLNQSYQSTGLLLDRLMNGPFGDMAEIQEKLHLCRKVFSQFFDIVKAEKAQEKEDELGCMLDSVAEKTAEAEKKIAGIYAKANEFLQELIVDCGVAGNSVYYRPTEKNMFCVHASKTVMKQMEKNIKQAPREIQEKYFNISFKSLTSAGRIEHSSLDKFQSELDSAKGLFSRSQSHDLPVVCFEYVNQTRLLWQSLEDWILTVDLALSMAKTAKRHGWIKPTIETTEGPSRVSIKNLRHPLIEVQKRQSKYVTHNISLGYPDSGQIWLLYGMNASGKSSLMKAIGLATLLAQVGSFVPATEMVLRPFRRLATRILNQDNLWAGLSSFAVEMSELREILAVADEETLVLGDELCAGTESISGTSIVAAGIQYLHKAGARCVLATHLHDLMKLKEITELIGLKVYHLHVEYDSIHDILVYHRILREGPGLSIYGLEVAKALHLPRDMVENAFTLRRKLLGETAIEEAKNSEWCSDVKRHVCSSCGKSCNQLEVHHIQPRADSKKNRNQDGTALNHIRNLAVLCVECHDKHHAGILHIGSVIDTSEGPKREILDLSQFNYKAQPESIRQKKIKKIFSDEQIQSIKDTILKFPGLSMKLYCYKIKVEYNIVITESQLKNLKENNFFCD